ncbi:MAG: PAC2 family protein [Flavobacteriales bacterium]|nr:PAC2 family protein [Flavobacteriales bacterium]
MLDNNLQAYSLVLHKDADPTTGGVAICGFTTAGMVGVMATSHIIKQLGLRQLGTVMHKDFPAVALIHNEVPKHPVRVYQGDGVGVFTSELQFGKETDLMFGATVLEWFTKGGFDQLIIIDGLVRPEQELSQGALFGVGSTPQARTTLKRLDIEPIQQGIVAGITGFLLGEGDRLGIEVVALLSEANPMYPDARAAAIAVEAVSDLTGLEIPLGPLLENAREVEDSVRDIIENAAQMLPAPDDTSVHDIDPSFG